MAFVCHVATESDWQKIQNIILDADTLYKIDSVRLDALPEGVFKENIVRDGKLIYRKGLK